MKKNSFFSLAIAGIFIVATIGIASANRGEILSSEAVSDGSSMEAPAPDSVQAPAPDTGTGSWYTEGPAETGSLPKEEDLSKPNSGVNEDIRVHENGGVLFRDGIDEGP